ncbi:MAG: type II secretion system F family protein [Rhodobacteraceae bacterium]|jgi:tight adherence protein C|uniref:type II secretion system F family protein n=1 Tax=Albidovulum sp. TaxID=1872424 RepID=UPI001E0E6264|nr:type II secretion system F family protein [uncultured Defluviimonas sp.]MCB2125600.1 type II secretion system F family protein [Paracoccaceae bacterium]MCC0069175.1 type II secretion system F family protein [Paracoccaceae bacterium]
MLSQINDFLIAQMGPLGPLFAVGVLGIALMAIALPTMLKKRADPFSRLRETSKPTGENRVRTLEKKSLRAGRGSDKLDKFAHFLEPKTEEEMSTSRLKMTRAGYRSKTAVRTFHAVQFMLGIAFLIIGVVYAIVASATGEIATTTLILAVVMPGAIGYYLPKYWIERRIQTRQGEIQNGFPDALDMLLVCVEAGQSLDQGIIRVSKELKTGYPALAEEFEIVAQEVKAGKDKTSVLRAFSERTGVPDIASFVTVMIQSQTFGTSIAEALRIYASEMRDKRVMRAEEAANKLPTKMTLGTMMFTVPPLLIILVGPSVYDMLQLFANFSP